MPYRDTQQKGDHAELRIASRLKRFGWNVLVPYSESQPYDLVAERDGEFVRLQVKSSTFDGTSITFMCYCSNSSKSGQNRTDYTKDDADGIAVYNSAADVCLWVPISDTNKNTMSINVIDASARNPVNEYLFESRFG